MPKVKISEYSATANSNTDVASINIDEGCAPSGINNAIRAVMGHLKDFQQGTYGDPFNGPVNGTLGATTASTAVVTTLNSTDATDASSTTAAAMKTAGGLAVAKKMFVGLDANIYGLTVGRGGAGGAANTAYGASAIPIAPNSGVVAIGSNAGKLFNTASDTGQSTFVGYFAGASCVSGTDNTFIGGSAGTNTTGSKNTAVGSQALQLNTTASNNTAVGYQAGYTNSTGTESVFIGYKAGFAATTNGYNTFVGSNAGVAITTGSYNCFIGGYAGANTTTGTNNTYIGANSTTSAAGYVMTTGSKNTIIGNYSGNAGGLDIRTASNYIVLSDGDGNVRAYWTNTGTCVIPQIYTDTTANAANVQVDSGGVLRRSTSALKYKQDIRDIEAIDINLLRPVRYKSKCEGDDQTKDHLGLIADEAAEAGFEELVVRGADGEVEGFQYERLTVVLLKAMQTLKAEVDSLKAQINGASA